MAHLLEHMLFKGTPTNDNYQQKLNAAIAKLTPAQVNAAIKKYIAPAKLVRVQAGDLAKKAK